MAYEYTDGDGLDALDKTKPNGATEPLSILDDAIRQIKAYLKDTSAGPAALVDALVPAGCIQMFGASAPPTGWLLCDGTAVSRTTYSELFGVIGTSFGSGNGSTTFNLPDFKGRAPVGTGVGDATDATAWSLAQKRGTESHVLTILESPAHTHTLVQPNANADGNDFNLDQGLVGHGTAGSAGSTTSTTSSIGGDTAHNNLQPSLGIVFIIKS